MNGNLYRSRSAKNIADEVQDLVENHELLFIDLMMIYFH